MIPVAKPIVGEEERAAVDAVLAGGGLAQGPQVAQFEGLFSAWVEGATCVAVNSGTSALHLAMLAAGIGPGDEVIVPSFTFAATANAVCLTGARPVFVDIESQSFCISPDAVEAAITGATRAIVPVHLYGHPADMTRIGRIAQDHGLLVIEDAAQAHGAAWSGRRVGSFGAAGAFSFYPTKNMTSGEGGMVTTSDEHLARTVRLLRNQGMEARYQNEIVGLNNRMTDIHAAIGIAQLAKLEGWTKQRQRNADYLTKNLRGVITPTVAPEAEHVFHQYTIRVPGDRDIFTEKLRERGVGSGVYYPIPVHRLPSFGLDLELPVTEEVAADCLSLPVHPSLSDGDLGCIVDAVNEIAGEQ